MKRLGYDFLVVKKWSMSLLVALLCGFLVPVQSSAIVTTSSVAFDANDSLTLTDTASDSVTATLTQTFSTTAPRIDSATVYVSITSSNASSATLRIKVSDSSTNISTDSGRFKTSPNICYAGLSCTESLTVFDTTTVTAEDGTSVLRTTTDFPSQAGTDTSTSNNAGRNYALDIDGGSYSLLTRNDSRTISLNAVQRHNSNSSYVATVKYQVGLHAITKAGTYTVVASVVNYTGGSGAATSVAASATWTVTVTGRDLTADVSNTTSRIYAGEGVGTSDSSVVTTNSTLSSDASANILVTQKNVANGNASESMTATISGPGWLTTGTSASNGTRPTAATGVKTQTVIAGDYIHVWSDGTAGVGTITITSFSGKTLGTETITFFGTRNKIAIDTTNYTIGRAGNGSVGYTTGAASATMAATDVAAFVVKVTDSGDRPVSTSTLSVASSNTAVVASGSCVENGYAGNPGSTGGIGYYNCSFTTAPTAKSGDKATLTFRITDPAVTTTTAYISVTADVTIGGTISTESASFDKATYEPGEKMVYTITAKDSSGNPVYDGATPATLTCNKTIGGSLVDQAFGVYVGGKAVAGDNSYEELFAPGSGGKFKCSGNGGSLGLSVITAEASVTDAAMAAADAATDAALEAIDAANAATDAANLAAEAADAATVAAEEARDAADAATAAVEALATEVATLMAALKAQITTLANTVAKIAKKVKA